MSQSSNRPGMLEISRAIETLKRRSRRRRRLVWLILVIALLAALLLTVARPIILTQDCVDPDLDKGSLVLVNRLATATATDVIADFEPSYSADTFYGTVSRAQEQQQGAGVVWLQLYPYITLVK